jgi:hypothetical protein
MRSGGRRQIDEIDSLGGPTQFFLDDRPAAPCDPKLPEKKVAICLLDSPLEEEGFKLPVPLRWSNGSRTAPFDLG